MPVGPQLCTLDHGLNVPSSVSRACRLQRSSMISSELAEKGSAATIVQVPHPLVSSQGGPADRKPPEGCARNGDGNTHGYIHAHLHMRRYSCRHRHRHVHAHAISCVLLLTLRSHSLWCNMVPMYSRTSFLSPRPHDRDALPKTCLESDSCSKNGVERTLSMQSVVPSFC